VLSTNTSRGGGIMSMLGTPYNHVVSLSYTRYLNGWSVPLRLLLYLAIMHILPILLHGPTLKGMVFMIVPEFVYTTCFTLCSQVNHLVPEATGKFDSNFFIHQVITGHNVNTSGFWTTLFTGGEHACVLACQISDTMYGKRCMLIGADTSPSDLVLINSFHCFFSCVTYYIYISTNTSTHTSTLIMLMT
jgi:hypothetical protein